MFLDFSYARAIGNLWNICLRVNIFSDDDDDDDNDELLL